MAETTIEFSEVLGRRVRLGSWEDQSISTYGKIKEAMESGDWDLAADLADYFIDEAQVCFSLYRQWINDLRTYLLYAGTPSDDVDRIDADVQSKLTLPDGRAWNAHRHWDDFRSHQRVLLAAIFRERSGDGTDALEIMKETWRQTHDRDVDHTYGLMSAIQERYGATGIAEMYERVLLPLFAWRYGKFDIDKHPWDEGLETLLLVSCEAMRGHLVGPERTGDFELVEEDDRFVLRFDPCGSGGRTLRGDSIEHTPARMEAPYNWGVSTEEASWNHYTKGLCLYCAHCIILMEEIPIDRFGYPVRVVDPPFYDASDEDKTKQQKCQWTMYKDPTTAPEDVYVRVGREKPNVFGSSNFDAGDLPDAGAMGLPGTG